MDASIAELASTIQSASINRQPDVRHDLAPSTSADKKEPITVNLSPTSSEIAEDEVPLSALHPRPRRATMPPLPDLRFEQSYLKSIENAQGWTGVGWITVRDQVFLPFLQGTLWTLLLSGWRHWNRSSQFSGQSVGARIRRWWWGVNKWAIPTQKKTELSNRRLAEDVREYYEAEFSNTGLD